MLTNPYVWHTHVTTYDAGPDQTMRLSSILKLQQEVGEMQLAEVNAGYRDQLKNGMAFVLTRTNVEIYRAPELGEKIAIKTWPRGTKGAQFFRCYEIYAEADGQLLTSSVSAFALVDPVEHKILRPQMFEDTFRLGFDLELTTSCPDPKKWAPPVPTAPVAQVTVNHSDTDWNHHLNNTVYADLLTDYMPDGQAFDKRISAFAIEFMREALPLETLDIAACAVPTEDGGESYVVGSLERGECFRAKATWKRPIL